MATCLGCGGDATLALHARSQDLFDDAGLVYHHYTELVFSCQGCLTKGALRNKLPEPARFSWKLDGMVSPIVSCPACSRQTHVARLWTCPTCAREGCAACMALHPSTDTCADCVGAVERAAHAEAYALEGVGHQARAEHAQGAIDAMLATLRGG